MAATMDDENKTSRTNNLDKHDTTSNPIVSNSGNCNFDPDATLGTVKELVENQKNNVDESNNKTDIHESGESGVSSSMSPSFITPDTDTTNNTTTTSSSSIGLSSGIPPPVLENEQCVSPPETDLSDHLKKGEDGNDFEKQTNEKGFLGFKLPHQRPTTAMSGIKTKSNYHDKKEDLESQIKKGTFESMEKTAELQPVGQQSFAFPKPISATRPPHQKREVSSASVRDTSRLTTSTTEPVVRGVGTTEAKQQKEKSPAEKLSKAPPLPYKEPDWSGIPTEEYYLEVLKAGSIMSKIELTSQAYHVFGRLETCDIQLEHPSLSRFHLVLQYRQTGDSDHDPGFYLYDLGSTHGSWVNKQKMLGRVYYRIRVGHMFKLGGSSRMYILQGPSEDQEAESDLSVKELRELRQHQLAELEEKKRMKREEEEALMQEEDGEKDAGISWGMEEDAEEADAMGDNPFAIMTQEEKEASYIKDPKKTLRGYFEREGYDLEYNVEEKESGFNKQFVCKIELPIDDTSGRPIHAEAAVSGKKKEAVLACALEACRILDAHGVLRQATHESKKRKAKDWKEDDYYDSDDDTFLDRTGAIEKKRMLRMKKAGMIKEEAQTYDSLKSRLSDVEAEIKRTENEMATSSKSSASIIEDDSLDAFMASIKSGKTIDRTWRAKLKLKLIELKKEQTRLVRLVNIAKPAAMPALQKPSAQTSYAALSKKLPMFGSMRGRIGLKNKTSIPSTKALPSVQSVPPSMGQSNSEEVEDDQEEDEVEMIVSPPVSQRTGNEPVAQKLEKTASIASVSEPSRGGASEGKSGTAQRKKNAPPARRLGPIIPIKIRKQNEVEQEQGMNVGETAAPTVSEAVQGQPKRIPEEYSEEDEEKGSSEKDEAMRREMHPPEKMPQGNSSEDEGRMKMTKSGRDKGVPKRMPPRGLSGEKEGMGSSERVTAMRREREMEEKEDKEDVADWMPPVGQSGDGRTHLNEKFGY